MGELDCSPLFDGEFGFFARWPGALVVGFRDRSFGKGWRVASGFSGTRGVGDRFEGLASPVAPRRS